MPSTRASHFPASPRPFAPASRAHSGAPFPGEPAPPVRFPRAGTPCPPILSGLAPFSASPRPHASKTQHDRDALPLRTSPLPCARPSSPAGARPGAQCRFPTAASAAEQPDFPSCAALPHPPSRKHDDDSSARLPLKPDGDSTDLPPNHDGDSSARLPLKPDGDSTGLPPNHDGDSSARLPLKPDGDSTGLPPNRDGDSSAQLPLKPDGGSTCLPPNRDGDSSAQLPLKPDDGSTGLPRNRDGDSSAQLPPKPDGGSTCLPRNRDGDSGDLSPPRHELWQTPPPFPQNRDARPSFPPAPDQTGSTFPSFLTPRSRAFDRNALFQRESLPSCARATAGKHRSARLHPLLPCRAHGNHLPHSHPHVPENPFPWKEFLRAVDQTALPPQGSP